MKKYFFTGLAVLLPAVFTLFILGFLIHFVTAPFMAAVLAVLMRDSFFNTPFLFFSAESVLLWSSRFIVLLCLVSLILLVGLLGRLFLLKWLGTLGDYFLHRLPLINKIYKPIQEAVTHIFSPKEKNQFSTVVLVPFPHGDTYSLGLVTNSIEKKEGEPENIGAYISVFVPGTPNPAMGFMLLYPEERLIRMNMRVEEALKFIVSCGVISSTGLLTPLVQEASSQDFVTG